MVSTTTQAFEQACITRKMAELVEKFLAGAVPREQVLAWARAIGPDGKPVRFLNPRADILHTCLCSLDQCLENTGTPIVRNSDLAAHLRDLRIGARYLIRENMPLVATVSLSPAQVAQRTGADVVRFWWPGLGWFEEVCFASAGTGAAFCALAFLGAKEAAKVNVSVDIPPAIEMPTDRSLILADLFDTLCIDDEDTPHLWAPLTLGWDLMRQDDNGNKFLVASFTGCAKAHARLDQLAAGLHKQFYWLEEKVLAGEPQ